MSTEKHTQGRLTYTAVINKHGGWKPPTQEISIYAGDVLVCTYATDYCEYPDDEANEANARRLVACWNLCDGIATEQIERFGPSMLYNAISMMPQRDELLAALEDVLATHSAERKAELSLSTATENYSDHNPELDAYTEAAAAASKAEQQARVVIAKVKGGAA